MALRSIDRKQYRIIIRCVSLPNRDVRAEITVIDRWLKRICPSSLLIRCILYREGRYLAETRISVPWPNFPLSPLESSLHRLETARYRTPLEDPSALQCHSTICAELIEEMDTKRVGETCSAPVRTGSHYVLNPIDTYIYSGICQKWLYK